MRDSYRELNGPQDQRFKSAFEFAAHQLQYLTDSYPDFFPIYTHKGKWHHAKDRWTNWCEGFLGGQLWLLYLQTDSSEWRSKAEHYSRLIEHRKADTDVHDLGFLFWPTWKRWFDITGDVKVRDVVVEAGKTLALRFRDRGTYLHSFVGEESLFIDIMMNVGIIFYSASISGDEKLWKIAYDHCLTTMKFLVREDGSTAHEGIFDLNTGQFIRQSTHQGWKSDSCWARGQAWALYGFGTAYVFTKDPLFLGAAQKCADYYLNHTPDHGVPPNDWKETGSDYLYESSAAAITASGLIQLASLTEDLSISKRYYSYALNILDTLTKPKFLALETPGWEGILKHAIYHFDKGLGVDESVMWGDYFYLEALSKALGTAVDAD